MRRRAQSAGLVLPAMVVLVVSTASGDLLPKSGADLIGRTPPEWTAGPEWRGSKPLRLRDLRGRVVMVRFWTDTCDGKIAFVHPGPSFYPRADAVKEGPNEDFEAIRAAIRDALREPR